MIVRNLQQNGYGLLYLATDGADENLVQKKYGEIQKGDMIIGKFVSPHPNLGTVSVRFNNNNRDSKDTLIFRLREADANEWIYQAQYNTDQFKPGELFPFGFPLLKQSANKIYIFELESLKGATGSGIFLDRQTPSFAAVSFFNKSELFQDYRSTLTFLINKIINVFGTSGGIRFGLVYFSPLILYFAYVFSKKVSYQFLPAVVLVFILLDLFFLAKSYDYYLISVGMLWLLATVRFKFDFRISGLAAMVLLMLVPAFDISGWKMLAEKAANWSYLFLALAVLFQIYQYKYPSKKYFSLGYFLRNLDDFSYSTKHVKKYYHLALVLFCLWLVYKVLNKVIYGLQLFVIFFPDTFMNPLKFLYLVCVAALLFASIWLVFKYYRMILDHKILIVVFGLILLGFVSDITANFTSFQYKPKIFSISPDKTNEAWVDITLKGKNFQDRPFVGKVYIDNVEQGEYVIKWTNEEVVVRTNPSITKSGSMCIQTLSKGSSNCLPFEYNFGDNNRLK